MLLLVTYQHSSDELAVAPSAWQLVAAHHLLRRGFGADCLLVALVAEWRQPTAASSSVRYVPTAKARTEVMRIVFSPSCFSVFDSFQARSLDHELYRRRSSHRMHELPEELEV